MKSRLFFGRRWSIGDPARWAAIPLILSCGAVAVACVSSSAPAPSTDPGGVGVPPPSSTGGGGGHPINGGPNELPDAGTPIDPCIGVSCDAPQVCSAGQCVDHDTDADGDSYNAGDDCDDHDPAIHPGATEVCNNKDDNCDKQIDEGFDKDGDGFFQCVHGERVVDCNDNNAAINDPSKPGRPTTADLFQPAPNPHWVKAGPSANFNATVKTWAQLTSDTGNQAGAVWWNAPYKFDHFELTAQFFMESVSGGGDGMTFAWVPGSDVSKAGNLFGFSGLGGGYAVAIDDIILPVAIIVVDSAGSYLKVADLPDIRGGAAGHELRVVLNAGKLSVAVDAVNYITDFAIPGYTPFTGHWGFTGATGTTGQNQFVQNVTMTFPDGQGCVP